MGYTFEMLIKESPEASTIKVIVIPVGCLTELIGPYWGNHHLIWVHDIVGLSGTDPKASSLLALIAPESDMQILRGSVVLMILFNLEYYELQY